MTDTVAVEFCQDLGRVDAAEWDALGGDREPFLSHVFLAGLERYGCLGREFGWYPCHVLLREAGRLVAAMPLYAKTNNYGEFVFDWAWQAAWERHGLSYYPKFVSAVPYTPATGPRLLVHWALAGSDRDRLRRRLVRAATEFALAHQGSGVHVLFPTADEQAFLTALDDPIIVEVRRSPTVNAHPPSGQDAGAVPGETHRIGGFVAREGVQYHWYNAGDTRFDDFLERLSSKKRKNIRRERRLAQASGLTMRWRHGDEISAAEWTVFQGFYVDTFERHMSWPTLTADFFRETGRALGRRVLLFEAIDPAEADPARALQAAALCYRSETTLYGRFWGLRHDGLAARADGLHFETCYYQGIEYCIAEGLERFEPGAQGEHKIPRGFVPTRTYSAHRILTPGFATPIANFCAREREWVMAQGRALWAHAPYVAERLPPAARAAASVFGGVPGERQDDTPDEG